MSKQPNDAHGDGPAARGSTSASNGAGHGRGDGSAALEWREGQPFSQRFDDLYFSRTDGRAETQEVFLAGNGLPDRWDELANMAESTSDGAQPRRFVIGELGFGTGLNFAETLRAFRAWAAHYAVVHGARRPPALEFISFEAYPMSAPDMDRALALWPELEVERRDILQAWPAHVPRDEAGGRWIERSIVSCTPAMGGPLQVTLRVWIGDVSDGFAAWDHGFVDAWYLDGFAPARNPQMWSEAVLMAVGQHTAPGGTVSTYTAAGAVRRGLEGAGFRVSKVPGFGGKRERLQGQFAPDVPRPRLE